MAESLHIASNPRESTRSTAEKLSVAQQISALAQDFADSMREASKSPDLAVSAESWHEPKTRQSGQYWIVRRGKHYNGDMLATVRRGRRHERLYERIIVHPDGKLDLDCSTDYRQVAFVPKHIENLDKHLRLDSFKTEEQRHELLQCFAQDLEAAFDKYVKPAQETKTVAS